MILAAVEGGGTTWVVVICDSEPSNIIDKAEFETTTPEITLGLIKEWLKERPFDAIGVASFGPIDCNSSSSTFGFITSTPKPRWGNTNVLQLLGIYDEFKGIPYKFDTDVNAPAFAEYKFYGKAEHTSCAYITIGTGVGVGLVINGKTVHGLAHPEAGHLHVQKRVGDSFEGTCPYHGSCIEGMCSTGALSKRSNCRAEDLPSLSDEDEVWEITSYYIAQLCASLIMMACPERIVIGGGLMNRTILYEKIREQTIQILNGYIQLEAITSKIDELIVPSEW
jgi:fructokinase